MATRQQSQNFTVYAEVSESQLRPFVQRLERFDATLRILYPPFATDPQPLPIYVVPPGVMSSITGSDQIAGFYLAGPPRPYAVSGWFGGGQAARDYNATVLLHEYAHHYMLRQRPFAYPPWFVEGFAEFISNFIEADDQTVKVGAPAKDRAYELLVDRLNVEAVLDKRSLTSAQYGVAWAMVHYFNLSGMRAGQLNKYLQRYGAGENPTKAAQAVFGDLKAFSDELNAYVRQSRLKVLVMAVPRQDAAIRITRLSPEERQLMSVRTRHLLRFKSTSTTSARIESATARLPDSVAAQALRAEGLIEAKRFADAEATMRAVLAKTPDDPASLALLAEAMERQIAEDDRDPAKWAAVRKAWSAANRAAPDEAWPLFAWYRTFLRAGQSPPDIGLKGLERALELFPQSSDIRLALGRALLTHGDKARAKVIVMPLVNHPYDAELREEAMAISEGRPYEPKPPAPAPPKDARPSG